MNLSYCNPRPDDTSGIFNDRATGLCADRLRYLQYKQHWRDILEPECTYITCASKLQYLNAWEQLSLYIMVWHFQYSLDLVNWQDNMQVEKLLVL
ncbi:hypothetical protein Plhal304r1_c006g0023681 [Plasmopara halstedii]